MPVMFAKSSTILIFTLSNLLLRHMLSPAYDEPFSLYKQLHAHQTNRLIENCAALMPFHFWLNYVRALDYQRPNQLKALLLLVGKKLDLS